MFYFLHEETQLASIETAIFVDGSLHGGNGARSCSKETSSPRHVEKHPGMPFLARFTDVAEAAGLTHPIIYGGLHKKGLYRRDGRMRRRLLRLRQRWMARYLRALRNTHGGMHRLGKTNRLYKNNRDGTFVDVTEKAGLLRTGWASSVTIGDYNNDGFEDVFITYYGQNVLYRNNGDGTFSDVTKEAGLLYTGTTRWGSGCTFFDYESRWASRSIRSDLCRFRDRENTEAR